MKLEYKKKYLWNSKKKKKSKMELGEVKTWFKKKPGLQGLEERERENENNVNVWV